jgi:adenylate cyclase
MAASSMGSNLEIERKFLVKANFHEALRNVEGVFIKQGYLSSKPEVTVRIRIKGEQAFLTVKGKTTGISRTEVETPIALSAANDLFDAFIENEVQKIRREVVFEGKLWEVDEFLGRHKGLWLAEIELKSEIEDFTMPEWLENEVSNDARYFNSNLAEHGLAGLSLD